MNSACSYCNVKIGVIKDKRFVFCSSLHRKLFWEAKEKVVSNPKPRNRPGYNVVQDEEGRWIYQRRVRNYIAPLAINNAIEIPADITAVGEAATTENTTTNFVGPTLSIVI